MTGPDAAGTERPGDPAEFGVLERRPGEVALRFVRHLRHPPAKVWRALTEPGHLAAWFPTTVEGDALPGTGPAHVCLDLLGYDLDEAKAPWSQDDRWRTVHRGYVARFGADAATIGLPAEWEQRT